MRCAKRRSQIKDLLLRKIFVLTSLPLFFFVITLHSCILSLLEMVPCQSWQQNIVLEECSSLIKFNVPTWLTIFSVRYFQQVKQ